MKKRVDNKQKVDISKNLEIERKCDKNVNAYGEFVPTIDHWLSIEEQKIKTKEIEEKT